jgi:hypothetical protein
LGESNFIAPFNGGLMNSLPEPQRTTPLRSSILVHTCIHLATTAGFCFGGCNASGDARNHRVRTAVRMDNAFRTHTSACFLHSASHMVILYMDTTASLSTTDLKQTQN